MNKRHGQVDYIALLAGLIMLVCGLYWFLSSVHVSAGFYGMRLGGFSIGSGLTIVPFLIGVIMLFFNFRSIPARLVTLVGFIIIIASIIMNTRFYFRSTSLFTYILMLGLICGGGVFILKAVFPPRKQ